MNPLHLGNFYLSNANKEDPALIYHNQRVTYEEMDLWIRRYMSLLSETGVENGDRVALSCFNTPEFIYSYFSIVKSGATVVPINLTLTMEEITYILKDSQSQFLVIHEKILQKLGIEPGHLKALLGLKDVIVLNEKTNEKVNSMPPALPVEIDPHSQAAILYTSGTTGKPKGAILSHYNLIENTISCTDALKPVGKDVFVCVLPMFHTFG
ncbi:MAG TPA: long-chain fatty acid--CoA ligase, partial [Paenibacillaceae bacterium]|nr:long-chain fatty acid--CoA ligase [Paenibacillaceae bacterium]